MDAAGDRERRRHLAARPRVRAVAGDARVAHGERAVEVEVPAAVGEAAIRRARGRTVVLDAAAKDRERASSPHRRAWFRAARTFDLSPSVVASRASWIGIVDVRVRPRGATAHRTRRPFAPPPTGPVTASRF